MDLSQFTTQLRINPQVSMGIHWHISEMLLVWYVSCTRNILDQIVATRGEHSRNVWANTSMVPGNKAVSHLHLTWLVSLVSDNRNTTAFLSRSITINGTEGDVSLTISIR